MDFKPRYVTEDLWLKTSLDAARRVIKGDMAEQTYIKEYIQENVWPENPLLKRQRNQFNQFIKKIEVKTRRLYYFHASGLTFRKLRKMFGYGHNRIQKYLSMEQEKVDREFISKLAIIHRVPVEWLESKEVQNKWEFYHFHSIGKKPQAIVDLLDILTGVDENDDWIEGFILKTPCDDLLYLRIETQRGNILIEVNNSYSKPTDILWLISNLQRYNYEIGYIGTVIPSHDNLAIVCKNNSTPFCLPVDYTASNLRTFSGTLANSN